MCKLRNISEDDFVITPEKIKQFSQERGKDMAFDKRVKGMVKCPVCAKIFISSEWKRHKWDVENRRKGVAKPNLIDSDEIYRCVVCDCNRPGTTHYGTFKKHLATHSQQDLEQGHHKI